MKKKEKKWLDGAWGGKYQYCGGVAGSLPPSGCGGGEKIKVDILLANMVEDAKQHSKKGKKIIFSSAP